MVDTILRSSRWAADLVRQLLAFSRKQLSRAFETGLSPVRPEIGTRIPSGDETILVVEDDTGVRELVRQVLQRQGYTLLEAQNGPEALRLSAYYSGPIHMLLTDVVMPGMSGKALAGELAHTRPELKVLFMSGYPDEAVARHGILDPGAVFLEKPLNPTLLAPKVRAVLDS